MEHTQTKEILLVVEDDLPVLSALIDKLTREGFTTLQAMNGEDGLVTANKNHPDLILLDIIMPKMDGLEMMQKLRAGSEWGKKVPIILLTNLSPDEERISKSIAENAPVYYFLKTEWSMGDLVKKMREILEK